AAGRDDGEQQGDPQAAQQLGGEREAAADRGERALVGRRLPSEPGRGGGVGAHRSSSSFSSRAWTSIASVMVRSRAAGTATDGSGPSLGGTFVASSRLCEIAASS